MGRSLQDRIKAIEAFRPDITFKDGTFILKIKYKSGWTIIKPQDPERVAFAEDKSIKNFYWYVANIEDTDMVFDVIEETINVNKEFEKKIELYKVKVQELKDLFLSNETYERLSTLQFVIPGKTKKKTVKQAKAAEPIPADQPITEEPNNIEKPKEATGAKAEAPVATVSDIDQKIAKALNKK